MSKHETWRTRKYWEEVGGLLIEEFIAVPRTEEQSVRLMDGLIVLGEKRGIHHKREYNIVGRDVFVIQTKARALGMYLLGQAYFSKFLIERHKPKSIRSVAICTGCDTIMAELAKKHGVEVVIMK